MFLCACDFLCLWCLEFRMFLFSLINYLSVLHTDCSLPASSPPSPTITPLFPFLPPLLLRKVEAQCGYQDPYSQTSGTRTKVSQLGIQRQATQLLGIPCKDQAVRLLLIFGGLGPPHPCSLVGGSISGSLHGSRLTYYVDLHVASLTPLASSIFTLPQDC